METPRWIPVAVGILAGIVLVQLLLTTRLWCSSSKMARSIERVEKAAGRTDEIEEISEALVETQEDLADLDDEVGRLRASTLGLEARVRKPGASDEEMNDIESDLSDMFPHIEALVDKKLKEKMAGEGPAVKYMSLDELSDSLVLNQYQRQMMADIFNQAKYDAFQVVSTPRSDGTTILEELKDALLTAENPRQEGMKVLLKLLVEDVPGTDETYFNRLTSIRKDAVKKAGSSLSETQSDSLDSMDVNVYGVETGYNPLADYFRDVMSGE